jgi:dGTPase
MYPLSHPLVTLAADGSEESPLAARHYEESHHPYRLPFDRDRGRIIHAKAFRRLAGKTQVFTERSSDHFRSRLTHTLEVAQIARTIASALGLNEALTDSLALVHDIGHPPFGHTGEKALDEAMREYGLHFDHNLHALRIVEFFEHRYAAFRGINLTFGLREGIIKHSHDYTVAEHPELAEYMLDKKPPLEAQLIDLVDEMAYLTADLDDGIGAGILPISHIVANTRFFAELWYGKRALYPDAPERLVANEALKGMLNALAGDLMSGTLAAIKEAGVETLEDVRNYSERLVRLTPEMEDLRHETKAYLYEHLYQTNARMESNNSDAALVKDLFAAYMAEPGLLPEEHLSLVETEGLARTVVDYLAGMTDGFIQQAFLRLA